MHILLSHYSKSNKNYSYLQPQKIAIKTDYAVNMRLNLSFKDIIKISCIFSRHIGIILKN